jgi:hypothetical protein
MVAVDSRKVVPRFVPRSYLRLMFMRLPSPNDERAWEIFHGFRQKLLLCNRTSVLKCSDHHRTKLTPSAPFEDRKGFELSLRVNPRAPFGDSRSLT